MLATCKNIFTLDDVINLNPVFRTQHAVDILKMISDVFQDIVLPEEHRDIQSDEELSVHDLEYGGFYDLDYSSDDSLSQHSTDSDVSGVTKM